MTSPCRRSARILKRPEYAMNRAVYKSMGYSDDDLFRPIIDIENRQLRLDVPDEEIATRIAAWRLREPKVTRGYLALYEKLAGSAAQGATLRMR